MTGNIKLVDARAQGANGTQATLIDVVSFLRAQVEWMTRTPEFPIDLFAGEVRLCVQALRRFDPEATDRGTAVRCPTTDEGGTECGVWLTYHDPGAEVTCPRCGASRTAMRAAAVVMADGRGVWLDPEAASRVMGISERHLRKLAARGQIERSHGRYFVQHAEEMA